MHSSAVIYLNFIFTTSENIFFCFKDVCFYQTTGGWNKLQLKYRILHIIYILGKCDTISHNMIVACIVLNLVERSHCFEVALQKYKHNLYHFLQCLEIITNPELITFVLLISSPKTACSSFVIHCRRKIKTDSRLVFD